MRRHLRLLSLAPLLLSLLAAGCNGSPSDPIDQPQFFSGELRDDVSVTHPLTLNNGGVIQIKVDDLRAVLVEGSTTVLSIGLALGRPSDLDAEECVTTFRTNAREGSVFSLGLSEGAYCIVVADPGTLPDDAIWEYTISVVSD